MEWKDWIGKRVFIRTIHGKVYSGKIKKVETEGVLTWIVLVDKFNCLVQLVSSEITEIKEEDGGSNRCRTF